VDDEVRNDGPRRNAMQQFIAKFGEDILGMKWYLAQNDVLCKQYEDHVKAISQRVKHAALAPFQQRVR
jgi:hypothetical protein